VIPPGNSNHAKERRVAKRLRSVANEIDTPSAGRRAPRLQGADLGRPAAIDAHLRKKRPQSVANGIDTQSAGRRAPRLQGFEQARRWQGDGRLRRQGPDSSLAKKGRRAVMLPSVAS
jgi:hypothetical protein